MIALLPSLRCAVTALFLLAAPLPVDAQPALAEVSPSPAVAVSSAPTENTAVSANMTAPAVEAGERATDASAPETATLSSAVFETLPIPAAPSPAPEAERLDRVKEDLRPLLTMLVLKAEDQQGRDGVEAGAGRLGEFQPFDGPALLNRGGALWLCLSLEDTDDAAPHTLWLDLGRQIPRTRLWMSPDGFRWEEAEPVAQGVYSLRAAGAEGHVLIRMEGMPGPWFSPFLRSPVSAADAPERGLNVLFIGLLALLALVDLLLCLAERSEARFWLFVLASAAMVQSLWPVPSAAFSISAAALPGIFAAGNVLHVHDLVDFVSKEAEAMAEGVAEYLKNGALPECGLEIKAGNDIGHLIPQKVSGKRDFKLSLRVRKPWGRCCLEVRQGETVLKSLKLAKAIPAEMIELVIPAEKMNSVEDLEVRVYEI